MFAYGINRFSRDVAHVLSVLVIDSEDLGSIRYFLSIQKILTVLLSTW